MVQIHAQVLRTSFSCHIIEIQQIKKQIYEVFDMLMEIFAEYCFTIIKIKSNSLDKHKDKKDLKILDT